MAETPQEYTARILSNIEGQDPWRVLEQSPDRARQLTATASSAQLAYKPSPERWSVTQILAHLADAEVVAAWRLRSVLAQDGVTLQAFDQNAWAEQFRYDQADPAESLDVFAVLRMSNLRLLRRVDPKRRQHAGVHQERGRESVEHLVRLYAGHDLNHLAQIEELMEAAKIAVRA